MNKIAGYNSYPGFGWVLYGRLVTNFAHNRVYSIYFNGELLWRREEV